MSSARATELTYTALFPFCGLGAGARGFVDARVRVFDRDVRFTSVGGIDNNPEACKDFVLLTKSPALCVDIRELTVARLLEFCPIAPDVVFLSAPCKGSSKLISDAKAAQPKYAEMNRLAEIWIELMLRAWPTLPRLVLFENVPNLTTRAKEMLKRVKKLLKGAGYLLHDGFHECGELGGLAQRRKRWLMVARHAQRVPPLLYQPPKKRVRACGEVLGPLPMPNHPDGGPMHVMPRISWLNWVRLALIPAGGDWRDLPGVVPAGKERREFFKRHEVLDWTRTCGTVGGPGSNGVENVADPRVPHAFRGGYRVQPWDDAARTVVGEASVTNGASIADPRVTSEEWFNGAYGVSRWTDPAATVTSGAAPSRGRFAIADPRLVPEKAPFDKAYGVLAWEAPARTVAGGSDVGQGAYAVADVRVKCTPRAGAYGVIPWQEAAKTVTGSACIDNGAFAVADPRTPELPVMIIRDVKKAPSEVPIIVAADGTWHRPLTTLELAVLQGLPWMLDGKPLKLAGSNVSAWRERIGNAVPPPAACAIAETMLVNLAAAETQSFALSSDGAVWVKPIPRALRRTDGPVRWLNEVVPT